MFTPRHRLHIVAVSTLSVAALAIGSAVVAAAAAPSERSTAATAAPWTLRLVAGSHAMRDKAGLLYAADRTYAQGGSVIITDKRIVGTANPRLYQIARRGPFSYRMHVQPGTYRVTVNLAEYSYRGPGRRVFAASANGRMVAPHVDAERAVGRLHAYHLRFTASAASGLLVLRFEHRRSNPLVSNVSIGRVGGPMKVKPAPTKPTPIKPTPTPTGTSPTAPQSSVTSSPTTAPSDSGSSTATPNSYLTPEMFGATGDGTTDDTTALQDAFDAASSTQGVWLAPGHVYAHSRVLDIRVAHELVTGGGTLLATDESASSVWADADGVELTGITIAIANTTTRGETWDQMGVRIVGHSGIVLRDLTVNGSAAAGIYVGNGASNFVLDHVTVRNTRADGIHMTGGAHNGSVIAPTVIGSGDDGVAVVSYAQDGTPCHDITVFSPTVRDQTWGRGISVVGGTNITETDISVTGSDAAAVYIGVEGDPWNTAPATNVTISGGTITDANTDTNIDHGAVFVLAGRSGYVSRNITISGLTITNTRSSASRDLGVVTYGSSPPSNVLFSNLTITGGPHDAYSGNTAQSSYRLRNITQNGVRVSDAG